LGAYVCPDQDIVTKFGGYVGNELSQGVIGFLSHWDPYAVINLEAVAYTVSLVHIVTQWSGSGGTEAYLSGQLASFGALALLVGSLGL